MKLYIIYPFLALIAIAFAKPVSDVEVIKDVSRHNAIDKTYHFNYKLNDGTRFKESGQLENAGGEAPSITVKGEYNFVVDGVEYKVRYTADSTGYHPEGDHLPNLPNAPVVNDDTEIGLRILGTISKAL